MRGITQKLKNELPADPRHKDNLGIITLNDGLGWKGSKLYVPNSLLLQVLQQSHDSKHAGHFGYLKTLHMARRQFWWPRMKRDIENYVRSCATCTMMKMRQGRPPGLLQQVAAPSRPWEEIAMER